jgi:hypothetical protein
MCLDVDEDVICVEMENDAFAIANHRRSNSKLHSLLIACTSTSTLDSDMFDRCYLHRGQCGLLY